MLSRRDCLASAMLAPAMLALHALPTRAQEIAATPAPEPRSMPDSAIPQPAYDVLRLAYEGKVVPYRLWSDWIPALVTTPGGGAWTFFGAQPRIETGLGPRQLYGARFNPDTSVWEPATHLAGGDLQSGPSAVVDSKGQVHLVYTEAAADASPSSNVLMYVFQDESGAWSATESVAPDPRAGYQNMSTLKIDSQDRLHVVWRDQRLVSDEIRESRPQQADLFCSDRVDGKWTAPVQINPAANPDTVSGWPLLGVSGERLIAIWSLYEGTELTTAARLEWASRDLTGDGSWSAPALIVERGDGDIGGRLVDLTGDAKGGITLVYGKSIRDENDLLLRRMETGASEWSSEIVLSKGDFGYLPSIASAPDDTLFVAFTVGMRRNLDVGGFALLPGADKPDEPVLLTPAEDGQQARASIALDEDAAPWIVYMHQPQDATAVTELRSLRKAQFVK